MSCLKRGFLLYLFIALISVDGCLFTAKPPSVYRIALPFDIDTLDPIHSTSATSIEVGSNLFNGLIRYRTKMSAPEHTPADVLPDLAESWTVSRDGKTYTFHLRRNVLFHNGRQLEAQDVKYSLERLADPRNFSEWSWTLSALAVKGIKTFQAARSAGKQADLEGVRRIDEHTLSLTLEQVKPFALQILAMNCFAVVPKEEVETRFSSHQIGTGPFKIEMWDPGQKIELIRNPYYFEKGLPRIDRLRYLIEPDEQVRLSMFESRKLEQLTQPIPAEGLTRLLKDPKWNPMGETLFRKMDHVWSPSSSQILKDSAWSVLYMGMDLTSEPFNDKRIRKALNYAIDKQKIADQVFKGNHVPARGILPFGFPGSKQDRVMPYTYDPKQARILLAQAGWRDNDGNGVLDKGGEPFKMTVWHNTSVYYARLSKAVSDDLRAVGIDAKSQALDWQEYLETLSPRFNAQGHVMPGKIKLFRFGWTADYADPDNFLWNLFSTEQIGGHNYSRYSNPKVDSLFEQARSTLDWARRKQLYQEAEALIIDDAPWIFLTNSLNFKVVQPYVSSQSVHPLIPNHLAEVSIAPH